MEYMISMIYFSNDKYFQNTLLLKLMSIINYYSKYIAFRLLLLPKKTQKIDYYHKNLLKFFLFNIRSFWVQIQDKVFN